MAYMDLDVWENKQTNKAIKFNNSLPIASNIFTTILIVGHELINLTCIWK